MHQAHLGYILDPTGIYNSLVSKFILKYKLIRKAFYKGSYLRMMGFLVEKIALKPRF